MNWDEIWNSITEDDMKILNDLHHQYGKEPPVKFNSVEELMDALPDVDPDSDDISDLAKFFSVLGYYGGMTPELSDKIIEYVRSKVYGPQP